MANKKKSKNSVKQKNIKDIKKVVSTDKFSSNEVKNLIKIVLIVCTVLVAFYFLTVLVDKNNKKNNANASDEVAIIQYEKILVGELLNRNENEYLVLVEKENDSYIDLYNYYLSLYSGKEGALKNYKINLSDVFNLNNVGEETIIDNDLTKIKFASTTLLKISNRKIVESYTNQDDIASYLDGLIK